MGETSLVPELFQKLRCSFCKKFLSVGPVFSISEDEELYKCGRCVDIECEISIQNFCFERIATYVNFPCSYDECDVTLPFGKMEEHEKFCPHRCVQCINLGCSLQIKMCEVVSHFKTCKFSKHENVFEDWAEFSAEPYQDDLFIIELSHSTFICVILFKSNMMYAGVFLLNEDSKKWRFTITLSEQGNDNCIIAFKNHVTVYDESVHCINCMRSHCELPNHKFSLSTSKCGKNISELPVKINFDLCNEILSGPSKISYSVTPETDFN